MLTPLQLVEKAAALIPRPHENLLVYFGVFAGNAAWRKAVVAFGRPTGVAFAADANETPRRSRSPRDWATLMRRGLDVDVLTCPECGSRLRIRAILDDPRIAGPCALRLGLARSRAGPRDLPRAGYDEPRFEPDPDFVEPDYDA